MTGIYTYSFWKLCYPSTFWWQTDWARSLGYCGSRRIRSFTSTLLSRKQRYSCRLLSRFSDKSCEYPRQGLSICCHIVHSSHSSVVIQWYPEVSHFCESVPLILVATKIDLRTDEHTRRMLAAQGQSPVTAEQGQAVAKEMGAKYIECSAKTGLGVKDVFSLALKESMKGRWGRVVKERKCAIL